MGAMDGVPDEALALVIRRRAERLEELFDEYEEEPVFEPIRERSQGLVVGTGYLMARIMFVGFSPGEDEDENGFPFAGPSGVVLDELLSSIGKSRREVYLTNVVKYRLNPDNTPLQRTKQVATSMRYMRREIAVIKPNVLVTLGSEVLAQFDSKKRLPNYHGRIINKNDRSIVPMYHPASVIREPQKRQVLLDDIQSVAEALKGYEFV